MEEVRKKIASHIDAGDAVKDIAERFMVSKSTVYKVKSLYNVSKDFSNRPRSGRPRTAHTEGNIKAVKDAIDDNPRNNIRKLARELNIDKTAISTIIFTVDAISNSRATRYIAKRPEDVDPWIKYVGNTEHPASVMMLGAVGSDGKAFLATWVKGTVDTAKYKNLLANNVFPALNRTYGIGKWTWTQDGAPAYTSKAYISIMLGSKGFWPKELWPPKSPNLNPLDF
ncbi:uncharacterized protein LOC131890740 [Tigriopus californicus]|uniref:uncharacterized protein LOC131890740 n=1 Tax=Tigriopus californicus TaxID=6832 RepID=UPI0027DA0AF7|nr:uncharacterized protein LOC131890740 [Tigriopus californicus]